MPRLPYRQCASQEPHGPHCWGSIGTLTYKCDGIKPALIEEKRCNNTGVHPYHTWTLGEASYLCGGVKIGPAELAQGTKFDDGKSRIDLIVPSYIDGTGRVLEFGARKYAPWNWAKGIVYSRCIGAALRHIFAFTRGERLDPETGLHHLYHASCCLMFLTHYEEHPELYKKFDDRPNFEELVNGTI